MLHRSPLRRYFSSQARSVACVIGYVPQKGKANPLPAINLKGRWLEELGFYSGKALTVTVEEGRLVIEREFQV
nr:SymE family type I addiction module toxin [Mixta theicola]